MSERPTGYAFPTILLQIDEWLHEAHHAVEVMKGWRDRRQPIRPGERPDHLWGTTQSILTYLLCHHPAHDPAPVIFIQDAITAYNSWEEVPSNGALDRNLSKAGLMLGAIRDGTERKLSDARRVEKIVNGTVKKPVPAKGKAGAPLKYNEAFLKVKQLKANGEKWAEIYAACKQANLDAPDELDAFKRIMNKKLQEERDREKNG